MTVPRRALAAFGLLFATGCISDELVVYDDAKVGKEAARRFVGEYRVQEWPGDMQPQRIRVSEAEGRLSFAYSIPGKNIDLPFVLSRIPQSEQGLYLLSVPSHDDTDQANLFFIGKSEKEKSQIWAVFEKLPVANGRLAFQDGKAKAADVKSFLSQHADEFVNANEPQVVLVNPNR